MEDAVSAEKMAADSVSLIRELIESLRAEFQPRKQGQDCLKDIPIYTRIETRGLLQKLRSIRGSNGEGDAGGEINSSSPLSHGEQRRRILSDFALPLAELVAKSYKILDELPESKPPMKQEDPANPSSKNQRTKNRPLPPRGMLSIQDYTDVACLLEFIVCTGILPYYDSATTHSDSSSSSSSSSNNKATTRKASISKMTTTTSSPHPGKTVLPSRFRKSEPGIQVCARTTRHLSNSLFCLW